MVAREGNKGSAAAIVDSIASVTAHADRDMLETGLVETLHQLIQADRVAISHIVNKKIKLKLEINSSNVDVEGMTREKHPLPLDEAPYFKQCFESGKAVQVPYLVCFDKVYHIYPIRNLKDDIIGFIELIGTKLTESDGRLLNGLMQIYRNYMRILEESENDTLTGLLNRRTFDRKLEQILNEPMASNEEYAEKQTETQRRRSEYASGSNWIAVLDIDFFKKVNDKYGHLYGDEVLLLLANIMRTCFRQTDKLFRFGGEEFVIVIRSATEMGAGYALERLRKKVEEYYFPQVGNVTVSIGYIEIRPGDMSSEVLSKADEALYYAKENGRNQVNSYEQLVADGHIKPVEVEVNDDIELF
ncbi:MAG TPA: GGDEF domain-containing protein [Gammaproteobacteria bacterium]|nr:GGDEF domain-containing protein [Gammaproteobacteria bacterium]